MSVRFSRHFGRLVLVGFGMVLGWFWDGFGGFWWVLGGFGLVLGWFWVGFGLVLVVFMLVDVRILLGDGEIDV